MMEEPNFNTATPSKAGSGLSSHHHHHQQHHHHNHHHHHHPQQQRPPQNATLATAGYDDSESEDNMLQGPSIMTLACGGGDGRGGTSVTEMDIDDQLMTPGESTSASKYDCDDSKANCKMLNGREARNRAEKNRRDKLNGSIQELSGMVPHVAESPRRVDKTAVLRFSAHALRVDYVFGKSQPEPPSAVRPEVQDTLFRMMNGFLLTVTCRGQIVLASASVEHFLGHCQADLYGQSLFNFIHPEDHQLLKQQLIPSNLASLFESAAPSVSAGATNADDGKEKRSHEEEEEIDRRLRQDRRKFTLRIARAGPRSEPTTYELVTIDGCFRRADAAPRGTKTGGSSSSLQLLRRARGRDDGMSLHSINANDIVLVAMARVMKVPTICDRLIEACKYEYKTRHLIDGRIVQCDHRISVVAGYLTSEVSGLSPFAFMHKDDVRWVIVALRQMYDYNQKDGESCYRLMTRTGDFIYLKTRGYLEVDKSTKVVQSFVCINTLVNEDEGKRLVREMKRKFSVIVEQEELPDESDEPAVENPQQIERAVLNLITNLHPDEVESSSEGPSIPPLPLVPVVSGGDDDAQEPLAIIAPKPSQVKSAIVKSMNVIAIASKKITNCSTSNSSGAVNSECGSPSLESQSSTNSSAATSAQRPSVVQKVVVQRGTITTEDSRVPPLPSSEHYFTQPYSPANSIASSCSSGSVLSPASQHHHHHQHHRNTRSPFGSSQHPSASPPPPPSSSASAGFGSYLTSYNGGRVLTPSPDSNLRTTSVLKRTYSNSSLSGEGRQSSASDLASNSLEFLEREKRFCRNNSNSPPDLNGCLSELVNPASDLTTMLPNAFDAVDQSLLSIESKTAIMREQVCGGVYEHLNNSQQRLDRIVEEQLEQREMLQSIQQEFSYQIQSTSGTTQETTVDGSAGDPLYSPMNSPIGPIRSPSGGSGNGSAVGANSDGTSSVIIAAPQLIPCSDSSFPPVAVAPVSDLGSS